MIKPTIGRRIWYWPAPNEGTVQDDKQAFDAGVIFVHSDTAVNLDICDHGGQHIAKTSVEIKDEATPGCAQWMPYQAGQAAKPESTLARLEKEMAEVGHHAYATLFGAKNPNAPPHP